MKEVVVVWGTRPESLKLGPVVYELRRLGVEPRIVATGQHLELLQGTPAETDLKNSYSLGLRSDGDVEGWVKHAVLPIQNQLPAENAIVVIQGDTMSAYAATLAAKDLGLTIAHVEAGVRSHNLEEPKPEEAFRVEIAQLADLHFAPTQESAENLFLEHVRGEVFVTGNTVVSALGRYATLEHVPAPKNQLLITMHRREWLEQGPLRVQECVSAVQRVAKVFPATRFLWPMHPVVAKTPHISYISQHQTPKNVEFVQPIRYQALIQELRYSTGVITDSGGLQEESATLGVPCAVMRGVTDRPESIHCGMAKLFPPHRIGMFAAVSWLLSGQPPRTPTTCFGTPDAAKQVAALLKQHM